MTRDEFREWCRRHCALWPPARAYLYDRGQGHDRCAAWFARLEPLDMETALEASVAMMGGAAPQPRGIEGHPAAIAEHARRLTARQAEPDPEQWRWLRLFVGCRYLQAQHLPLEEYLDRVDRLYDELDLPKSSSPRQSVTIRG